VYNLWIVDYGVDKLCKKLWINLSTKKQGLRYKLRVEISTDKG